VCARARVCVCVGGYALSLCDYPCMRVCVRAPARACVIALLPS